MSPAITKYLPSFIEHGFPVSTKGLGSSGLGLSTSTGSFWTFGPKTGWHHAKNMYINHLFDLAGDSILRHAGPVAYMSLFPAREAFANAAALRASWAIIQNTTATVTAPGDVKGFETSATYVLDPSATEGIIRGVAKTALQEFFRTAIDRAYLSQDTIDKIQADLEHWTASPFTFEEAKARAEGPLVKEVAPIVMHLPDNAIGKLEPITAEFTGNGTQTQFSPITVIEGEQVRAWLVPGRQTPEAGLFGINAALNALKDVLTTAHNVVTGSVPQTDPVLTLHDTKASRGTVLNYGRNHDWWIENGQIYLREPPPKGSTIRFSGQYVHGQLQPGVLRFAPFFSGVTAGMPTPWTDEEGLGFFTTTGISPETWKLVTQFLGKYGGTISDLSDAQKRYLTETVSSLQAGYDLVALSTYAESQVEMPRQLASRRFPNFPDPWRRFLSYRVFGWLHVADAKAPQLEQQVLDFGTHYSAALDLAVHDVIHGFGVRESFISRTGEAIDLMMSEVDLLEEYAEKRLESHGFDDAPTYRQIVSVYTRDHMTRWIIEKAAYGDYKTWDEWTDAIKEESRKAIDVNVERAFWWVKGSFGVASELADSFLGRLVPVFRPSSPLQKQVTPNINERVQERWSTEVRPVLREDLITWLRGYDLQSLPEMRPLVTAIVDAVARSPGPINFRPLLNTIVRDTPAEGPLTYYDTGARESHPEAYGVSPLGNIYAVLRDPFASSASSTTPHEDIGVFDYLQQQALLRPVFWALGIYRLPYEDHSTYSLTRWMSEAAKISHPGRRTSVEAYVDDLLDHVGSLVDGVVPVMKTRAKNDFWITAYAFEYASNRMVDKIALEARRAFIPTGVQIPSTKTDAMMPIYNYAEMTLDSISSTWRDDNPHALDTAVDFIMARLDLAPDVATLIEMIQYASTPGQIMRVPEMSIEVEQALDNYPVFKRLIEIAAGVYGGHEKTGLLPQETPTDDYTFLKWRGAILAQITSYSQGDYGQKVIPGNRSESIEFMNEGWEGVLGWLGPRLAAEFNVPLGDVLLMLEHHKMAFIGLVDKRVFEIRLARDVFWDPERLLHYTAQREAHVSYGQPPFRSEDSIHEAELPTISAMVASDMLEYARDIARFALTDYSEILLSRSLTEGDVPKFLEMLSMTAANKAFQGISPTLPLHKRIEARETIRRQLQEKTAEHIENVTKIVQANPTTDELSQHIELLRRSYEELAMELARPWSDEKAFTDQSVYESPQPFARRMIDDPALPVRWRIELMGSDDIEQAIDTLLRYWTPFLQKSIVTGIQGQDYARVFNTVDWTRLFPTVSAGMKYGEGTVTATESYHIYLQMPDGTTQKHLNFDDDGNPTEIYTQLAAERKAWLVQQYESAKQEFLADTERMRAWMRKILYQVPLSTRMGQDPADTWTYQKFTDLKDIESTCFRLLTRMFEEEFKTRITGVSSPIKFQEAYDLGDKDVVSRLYVEVRNKLMSKDGILREAYDAIRLGVGDREAQTFYDQIMREWNAIYSRTVSQHRTSTKRDVVTYQEWGELVISATRELQSKVESISLNFYIADKDVGFSRHVVAMRDPHTPLSAKLSYTVQAMLYSEFYKADEVLEEANKQRILEQARVASPVEVNQQIAAFASNFTKAMAGLMGGETHLSTREIQDVFSRSAIERAYRLTVAVVDGWGMVNDVIYLGEELGERVERARMSAVTPENLPWLEVIDFMRTWWICYPEDLHAKDVGKVLDGFDYAMQLAETDRNYAMFAKLFLAVAPRLQGLTPSGFEKGGAPIIDPLSHIFRMMVMQNQAGAIVASTYVDGWGIYRSKKRAIEVANYNWMLDMLSRASLGDVDQLVRFDTQFDLIWKPFMEHESRYRTMGALGAISAGAEADDNPTYFLDYGKRLQEIRETVVSKQRFFPDPVYGTHIPKSMTEDDPVPSPIVPLDFGPAGGDVFGYVPSWGKDHVVTVYLSDGEEVTFKIFTPPGKDMTWVHGQARAKALQYFFQIDGRLARIVGSELLQSTPREADIKGEEVQPGGGGKAW